MTSQVAILVDVQIACDDSGIPSVEEIETWVVRAVAASGEDFKRDAELSVRLVDTEEIQALNRDFRQQDAATNVLSFPAGSIDGLPADAAQVLGDVVVCAAVVSQEAREQNKAVNDHWAHMLVHGTLHLLGFDHESDPDAARMERLEAQILIENGLADPYTGLP